MVNVQIFSANACPYAQRSRLTLLEKGVPFEVTEIDLRNKPDWFAEVSPYGKVPVLKHGEHRVWESAVVNEYLDEVFPEPPLMPEDPAERAIARIWIDFANTKFTTAFYKLLISQEPEKQEEWSAELGQHLLFMEREGISKLSDGTAGPYWFGSSLSLVDVTYYPWFERFPVLTHYRGMELPPECDRLRQWWSAMQERASVRQIANSADYYIEQYTQYANNTATGITAQEMRKY